MKKKINRDTVLVVISLPLVMAGIYGMHDDWTMWAMLIPFGWGVLGVLFDFAVNGKENTRESIYSSAAAVLLLVNVGTILIHRDTPFILGRLLCSLGLIIMIIRSIGNTYTLGQKELEKKDKRIAELEDELHKLLVHHDRP